MNLQKHSLMAVTLLALLLAPLAWANQPAVPAAITEILDRKIQAWNAGDAHAWGADYTADTVVINLFGTRLEGNEENIARHAEVFAAPLANTTLAIDVVRIHQYAPGTAIVEAHLTVSDVANGMERLPLTDSGELHTRMSFLMDTGNDNNWQIRFAQNTAIENPSAAQ